MKKNYYAKVLALTVAASMVSVPAFAEEGDGTAVAAQEQKKEGENEPKVEKIVEKESEDVAEKGTVEEQEISTYSVENEEITAAGGALQTGTYILKDNVALNENITIPDGAKVTIDLNGHVLTGNGKGSVIRVYGKLTILDSGNGGKIAGGFKNYTGAWVNNVEHDGGGIFVDTHAEVILESGSITGNDAWNGGGVYVNGGGSFTMNGGEISNNRTLRPYHGGGGGIYVLNDETKGTGKFVMNGGVIKENTTLTQGGGAFIDGEMEMNGGKIIDNTGLKGGGVCINGTMTLNNGVVSRNKAEFLEGTQYDAIECGGIKINGGTLNLNGGEITDNTAISTEKTNAKDEEVEDAVAAGIYNIGTLNVSGAPVVSGNTTDDKAQNIYLSSGRVITLSDNLDAAAKLYTTLDSETGRATDTDGYTAPEGTILSDKEGLTVETHKGDIYFFKDVPVENAVCSTWIDGEQVYHENLAAAVASLPSDDNVVTILNDCELTSQVGVTAGVEAILTSETPVSITWKDADKAFFYINEDAALSLQGPITVQGNYKNVGNEVSGNTDLYAFDVRGTLNIGERGTADDVSPVVKNFNTVTVNSNKKPSSGYGAIQANGGKVNLYSGILEGNTAYLGGAIYATNTATVNLIGGEITGNYACYGGGVGVTNSTTVNLSGTKIDRNHSYKKIGDAALGTGDFAGGAGIYAQRSSVLDITGGVVKENVADSGVGGGIYLAGSASGTMSAGEVKTNQATTEQADFVSTEARGGGMYISNSAFTLSGGSVEGNKIVVNTENETNTSVAGGGVVASGGSFTMTGGSISGNSCPNYGGGLYVTTPTVATLTGGKITENTAASGGGVYVASSTAGGEELHLSGSPYIANNTATESYPDVLLSGTSEGSNTTFPARVITLDGALTSGAHIGVQRKDSTTVIAKGTDTYAVMDNDAAYFIYSNDNKLVQKDATKNQLVLAEKEEGTTYYTVTLNLPDHVKADRALTAQVADNGTYEVTLTAEKGYKLSSVTVGGEEKTLVDGKLTLNPIYGNTTITVTEEKKAAPTLTLSSNSGIFRINRGPVTFTYTYNGDGAVTATSSDDSVATAEVKGNTITVTLKSVGTARITVSAAEGDNFLAKDATYDLTVQKKKSSSSSSDTSAPTYGVSTGKTENGTISVTPAKAEAGEKVTIKATPDSGYQLDKVTVKDKDNSNVKLTKVNDNEYTFTMPKGKVSVDATFVQKDAADANQNSAAEKSKVIKLQIGSRIVNVDNEAVIYDAAPVIRNDRTLVPIRIVTETLGGKVDWNGATKEVTLHIDGKEIKMTIGKTLEKYGVAPVIIDGRTFVPVRFVADELGATVAWDDATKTVTITKIEK